MNLLQEHADRELLRQSEEIFRLTRARLEKPDIDPSFLPRLILAAAEDRVHGISRASGIAANKSPRNCAARPRPVASTLTGHLLPERPKPAGIL